MPLQAKPNKTAGEAGALTESPPQHHKEELGIEEQWLITCTLLYCEGQGFYWVILFPWRMCIISFMEISGEKGAQELPQEWKCTLIYTPGAVSEHWRALISKPRSRVADGHLNLPWGFYINSGDAENHCSLVKWVVLEIHEGPERAHEPHGSCINKKTRIYYTDQPNMCLHQSIWSGVCSLQKGQQGPDLTKRPGHLSSQQCQSALDETFGTRCLSACLRNWQRAHWTHRDKLSIWWLFPLSTC